VRTFVHPPLKRIAAAAAGLALAAACAAAWGAPAKADPTDPTDEKGVQVQDPHYGDALFHFYKGRYFTAVTTLMASQHFERVAQHADEAEVLRGGLLLSYGLHKEAGEIFAALIEKGAPPSVRDRAWFFLAKIRYQRGFYAQAEDALGRIGDKLPKQFEEERALLQANLLLARADYAAAAALLNGYLADKKDPSFFTRYNLGVALIRSGETERGSALLDELGKTPADNEEQRTLRDKANVALGFAALQEQRPEVARTVLERVRLKSLQSNKALLGFGWAAATLKEPKRALVPWMELLERDASDSAVLEARIAVPYAYAEIGAYGQALERYNDAIAQFEREAAQLDQSIVAIRAGKLLAGLMERNPGEEMGWFWNIAELPEMPHGGHLAQVFAQHEFQEAFKNFRDLQFLAKNLSDWQENLGVYGDMLDNRRNAYAKRLPEVRAKAGAVDIDGLQKRRDAVVAEIDKVEQDRDAAAFADAKQRELLERLESVQATLKALAGDAALATQRERARLAAGALTWEMARQLPGRAWEAKKQVRIIDNNLEQVRARDAAIAQAQRDEPARQQKFAERIAELDARLRGLVPRVAALSREQQGQVQELAVAELERQKDRLAIYATQARYAVAQLYDRANLAKRDDDAPKQ
jgi:hypothetical protein